MFSGLYIDGTPFLYVHGMVSSSSTGTTTPEFDFLRICNIGNVVSFTSFSLLGFSYVKLHPTYSWSFLAIHLPIILNKQRSRGSATAPETRGTNNNGTSTSMKLVLCVDSSNGGGTHRFCVTLRTSITSSEYCMNMNLTKWNSGSSTNVSIITVELSIHDTAEVCRAAIEL